VADRKACIWVLAGTNGAGKSSVAGATLRAKGSVYYNPDEAAREYRTARPQASVEGANGAAWELGRQMLARAIRDGLEYVFETTLGGNTIPAMLEQASAAGHEVHIWFTGLGSVELHLERVRQRVLQGGHDIPPETIRHRYKQGLLNLIRLMPGLTSLRGG